MWFLVESAVGICGPLSQAWAKRGQSKFEAQPRSFVEIFFLWSQDEIFRLNFNTKTDDRKCDIFQFFEFIWWGSVWALGFSWPLFAVNLWGRLKPGEDGWLRVLKRSHFRVDSGFPLRRDKVLFFSLILQDFPPSHKQDRQFWRKSAEFLFHGYCILGTNDQPKFLSSGSENGPKYSNFNIFPKGLFHGTNVL